MTLATSADFDGHRRKIINQPLSCALHEPVGIRQGLAIIVPGWSGPRSGPADLLVYLASKLAQAGWQTLRLDLPGRGDAEGNFRVCNLDDMIASVQTAIEMFHCASERTCVLGLCSGGNVALGALASEPLALSSDKHLSRAELNDISVIALSTLPFQSARAASFERRRRWRNIKQYAAKVLSPVTWLRLIRGELNLQRVKKNVMSSEKPTDGAYNLKDSARNIEKELLDWKGRALFIWGSGDEEAALARAHFEKLHAAGMSQPNRARFHTIAGSNHNFYARIWREELNDEILAFLSASK